MKNDGFRWHPPGQEHHWLSHRCRCRVEISGGILGGKGIIAGVTTVGTGSGTGGSIQPGKGATTPTKLTIQNSLTFRSDGTYTWKLNTKKAKPDQVIANGVTIEAVRSLN